MKAFKRRHEDLVRRQEWIRQRKKKIPINVVLDDIRSLYNVGAIFRTADAVGCEKLWLCGITGFPPNPQLAKTALGAQEHVPWEYARDVTGVVDTLKTRGYQVVLLEQTSRSVPYQQFQPDKRPVCLVVGNEVEGLKDALLDRADAAVEIPMRGIKSSLNVGVAFGVVAYHLQSKINLQ